MSVVDPLQQRLSNGLCGRCAELVAGRGAPDQLLLLLSQQEASRASSGANSALRQLEPTLDCIRVLSKQDWAGVWLVVANILILVMLRKVLRQAAHMGLLDRQSDEQLSITVFLSVQHIQEPQQIQPQQEQEQQQQQQPQPDDLQGPQLHQNPPEPPELRTLQVTPYTDISIRLSPAWLVLGEAPHHVLQGGGEIRWDLGHGSFGCVYAALYHGQLVVVKELRASGRSQQLGISTAQQAECWRRGFAALLKEAAMMEASRHSSVVQCLAICKEPPALVLEWCYGGNLSQPTPNFLASASAVDALKLLYDGAAAVAHLHSQKRPCGRALVHGDLRACNVLLKNRSGPDWGIKVADFGLAEWLQPDGRADVQTVTNHRWVAPEVVNWPPVPEDEGLPLSASCTISRASEVYMFGMLMYEVLTGMAPYEEELYQLDRRQWDVMQHYWNVPKMYGVLHLPAVLRFNPSAAVQSQLRGLYQQCTSSDPHARPTMERVMRRLDEVINMLVAGGG